MSLEEEEYDRTGDEEGSESNYSEGHVSQLCFSKNKSLECFLSGKKRKNNFEEVVNVFTEPPPPLPQNYEEHDFWQLTQPDGNGHLFTSVATILVSQSPQKIYLILIEVRRLNQILKATNLMSVIDCKIGNGDNQVILAMIERWWTTTHTFHLPCGKLGITPRDFTVLTGISMGTKEPMEFYESSTVYGIKAKHHLALMRQQLDLRTINNMQWDILRNMKDALKREGIVVDWEDDEGEAGTSQVGTSRGRGSQGRTYEGGADPP
ncbi:hypothetical protein GIB67_030581 [Kingdonia uniflora]|uniref:Aminotransferase-like plant mobile domain-containing protein n=1 Tax=Kingdonia uniflora TaxID=39325 RepID=A0A7J7PCH9_9MAGN|nr:hypothetical protein GIB67_030581 [Kingdonia uniflora]